MLRKSCSAFFFVVWRLWASADGDLTSDCGESIPCETRLVSTDLGSSVLLPCNFTKDCPDATSWTHSGGVPVVNLSSAGRVNFFDSRSGRLCAFPNEGARGNFSISIDNVNDTDLGCYRCLSRDNCVQVQLALRTESGALIAFYIYIVCVAAAIVLLTVGCVLFFQCPLKKHKKKKDNFSIVHVIDEDSRLPAQEIGGGSGEGQPDAHRPASCAHENVVSYENDACADNEAYYVNKTPGRHGASREEASSSCSTSEETQKPNKLRFHNELINRLRQVSLRKHHYVNQATLRKQKENEQMKDTLEDNPEHRCQFQNPIYNGSCDPM